MVSDEHSLSENGPFFKNFLNCKNVKTSIVKTKTARFPSLIYQYLEI